MYKKLLVLVDDREVTQSAIRQAIELARVHRADILFFYILPRYVVPTYDMLAAISISPEEFQSQANDQAHTALVAASERAEQAGVQNFRAMGSGTDDVQCICDMARNRQCDLIVVATEGDNAVMRILSGSIIPGLITVATVPVLVCRQAEPKAMHARKSWASLQERQLREQRVRRHPGESND